MSEATVEKSRILIVDDNAENVFLLMELLTFTGYQQIRSEMDSTKVIEAIQSWKPDLVVLDLHMPKVSGFDILKLLPHAIPEDSFLPILVFTADWTEATRKQALTLGAWDFITKPFDATELLLRVRNFLRMRSMHVSLAQHNRSLEALVERRTRHVIRARTEALECLARAAEFRDDATGEHAKRVGKVSGKIARELGVSKSATELIEAAAPLHDVGKIAIADAILMKPGKLTTEEFDTMKQHAEVGGTIIGRVKSPLLRKAREISLYHHENWDGTGYPFGVSGEQIPIAARIVAVADTFDALTHERPYKKAWPLSESIEEVKRQSGIRFDPRVVEAFLRVCSGETAVVMSVTDSTAVSI